MRLIDADALSGKFDERYDTAFVQERTRENKEHWNGYCTGVNWGRNTIADAPTVDAVEVVRCKDCKHNEDCINRIQFWGRNPVLELNTTEYHPLSFCSYGEKREEA